MQTLKLPILKLPGLRGLGLAHLLPRRKKPVRSVLALQIQDGYVGGVLMSRTNGSARILQTIAFPLSLNLSVDDPVLIGREIRKQLDAQGVRERRCAVCIPVRWVLTSVFPMPDLPEADAQSYSMLQAERTLPYALDAMHVAYLRARPEGHEQVGMAVAVLRTHVQRVEQILRAAGLRPVSLTVGALALASMLETSAPELVMVNEGDVAVLLVVTGGGVVAFRVVDGPGAGGGSSGHGSGLDHIPREVRLTLGQLPVELQGAVRTIRVYAEEALGRTLVGLLSEEFAGEGIRAELVSHLETPNMGVAVPTGQPVAGAVAHGLGVIGGRLPVVEFLPEHVSPVEQLINRYLAGTLLKVGAVVAVLVLIIAGLFVVQQLRLMYWSTRWKAISEQVKNIESTQQLLRKFRPWFDDSCRTLWIMRRLTEAFPEEGTVSLRTLEIRDSGLVICSGTARDNAALLRVLDRLRTNREVGSIHVDQTRGTAPMQFTFRFEWRIGGVAQTK